MRADKSGDRLAVALETKAYVQFISYELKVGRFLQRDKIFEELYGLIRPIRPVRTAGELSAEFRAVVQPTSAESIKVGAADLKEMGSIFAVDEAAVKLLEDVMEKGVAQASG